MEKQPLPQRKIFFVCTNRRPKCERVSCAHGGGDALRDKLKEMVKKRGLKGKIRVSQSGCMDRCEKGPNIMLFPDNIWYSEVTEGDLETILDDAVRGLVD